MAESEVGQEGQVPAIAGAEGPAAVEDQDEELTGDSPEPMVDYSGAEGLTEVYHTDNAFAADVVIGEILAPEGIQAVRHERRSNAIPAPAALAGEIGIAVPEAQAARALQLLREARADGVLEDDGDLVGDDEDTALA